MQTKPIIFLLIAVCFLIYFNALHGEFISDDNIGMFVINDRKLTPVNSFQFVFRKPVYNFFKNNPTPFHLNSIFFHSLTTVFLFFLLKRIVERTPAFIGALFFAVHPIHTEVVDWISADWYIFISLIIFTILLLYRKEYVTSLFLYGFFLFSSDNVAWLFTLPVLIALYELSFKGKGKNLLLSIPFFILSLFCLLVKAPRIQHRMEPAKLMHNVFIPITHSITSNLFYTFFPFRLSLYHEPVIVGLNRFLFDLIITVLVLCLIFIFWKKSKLLFWGLLSFLIFLIPTYSPKAVCSMIAERYLYFPSILFSCVVAYIYSKFPNRRAFIFLALVFLIFSFRTVSRNEDYRTNRRLWEQTIKVNPLSYRAHNDLGKALLLEGNVEASIKEFQRSVKLVPFHYQGWANLGTAYLAKNNYQEAMKCYEKSLKINDTLFIPNVNLGILYLYSGRFDEAVNRLVKAQKFDSEDKNISRALTEARKGLKNNRRKNG